MKNDRDEATASAVATSAVTDDPPAGEASVEDTASAPRTRVARSILEHGPSTAADVAQRLDITTSAVRRHLDTLTADGVLEPVDPPARERRGRGRPAKVFRLTDAGREQFEHAYDDLAVSALRYMSELGGADAVEEFARRRLVRLEEAYRLALSVVGPEKAPEALAELLTEEGYAATIEPSPQGGLQICQHHCPVAHVAAEFPQLCEAETKLIGQMLGTHVQRLATIAHGDGVCTTHIPPRTPAAATDLGMPGMPEMTATSSTPTAAGGR